MTIGERIKKKRNEKDFSLRELAAKVDLSASFLSQIEQGKASPSIENLKKIANYLEVKVSYLIEEEDESLGSFHIKKEDRKYVESIDSKTSIALLTSSKIEKNMEPIMYEIKPGGESGRGFFNHNGEEFIYIIEGTLDIYIEDQLTTLNEGDSFYFKSSLNHRFKNNGKKLTKAIWVVTPPTF
ncbi:cupin domain-containing protein [Fusobacterium perfoetens]|uniref:helix-turn-helix domain-containing protein n=1 Tax=Fusobacterium perfoetens TaxID=852 RepID=UPI0015A1F0E7|nr:cupin domain-containing protein [Fusobacterium perfoetens]MCF2626127.1 cupin domain-containing protein [Fusobacterium perfoetens]